MNRWNIYKLSSIEKIYQFLETDRYYAAYAIGDLDPMNFSRTRWWGAEQNQHFASLVMLYEGLDPPILFTMGHKDGIRRVLTDIELPSKVYLTCRADHISTLWTFFSIDSPIRMWRMLLSRWRDIAGDLDCVRLNENNIAEIIELFEIGQGTGFSPNQVANGIFYGIFDRHRLVAMAGTHLASTSQNIGAIGSVVTHPDYRGNGYATKTTNAVVGELVRVGIRDIILNVAQDNSPAMRVYSKIGFEIHCPFIEGEAVLL